MEEACIEDKNLFNPLMIQTAMTDVSMIRKEIDQQTYHCYIDETRVDVAVKNWLPDDLTDDDKFNASYFLQSPHCILNWGNCF